MAAAPPTLGQAKHSDRTDGSTAGVTKTQPTMRRFGRRLGEEIPMFKHYPPVCAAVRDIHMGC